MILSRSWNNRFKIQNRVGVHNKSHPYGFLMKQLLHIKQSTSISNSRPQNHFRGNFSPNSQQGRPWTSQINNQMSDIDKKLSGLFAHQNRSQNILQKVRNTPSSKPVYQCTNQAAIHPSSSTLRSASGQSKRPRRCSGPRTLRTMCSVKIDFPIWEKCMPDVKLTETLQMTLKRDIIVVRTSRFWYDNGML